MPGRCIAGILFFLAALPLTAQIADRNWQTGTLISAERHDDPGYGEHHRRVNNGDSDDSPPDTTAGSSNLHSSWMYYTVSSGNRLYIVRVMANLSGATKPKADVGEKVEYAVDGAKFYFHNPDGSEARADLVKTTAQEPQSSPPPPPSKHPDAPQS